jgi:hypothetical protein
VPVLFPNPAPRLLNSSVAVEDKKFCIVPCVAVHGALSAIVARVVVPWESAICFIFENQERRLNPIRSRDRRSDRIAFRIFPLETGAGDYFTILMISLNSFPSAILSSSNSAVSTLVKATRASRNFCKPISLFSVVREETASTTTSTS